MRNLTTVRFLSAACLTACLSFAAPAFAQDAGQGFSGSIGSAAAPAQAVQGAAPMMVMDSDGDMNPPPPLYSFDSPQTVATPSAPVVTAPLQPTAPMQQIIVEAPEVQVTGSQAGAAATNDPCASYGTQQGYTMCRDQMAKIERMNAAKESRQASEDARRERRATRTEQRKAEGQPIPGEITSRQIEQKTNAATANQTPVSSSGTEGVSDEQINKALENLIARRYGQQQAGAAAEAAQSANEAIPPTQ